jgi:hypothetical protein
MDNRLREALRLVELGLAVHLLHPRSKEPIAKKWQQAPAIQPELLALLYRPGMEIGIHTGAVSGAAVPVVVLDLDNPESVAWARSRFPLSPVRALTRRGEHWYFRHPGSIVRTRHKPDRLALDVQAEGAHVVCPPSLHATGFVYAWIGGPPSPASLASLPLWSADWFPPPAAPAHIPRRFSASRRDLARALGAARKWQTFEESAGRGTQTFKLAQFLTLECSLSPDAAFAILWQEWNPRLSQPYSEPLLRRKVEQARRSRLASLLSPTPSLRWQATP